MVNSPSALTADAAIAAGRRELSLNSGWEYHKGDCSGFENADFNSGTWTKVNIPHNTSLYTAENKGCYKGISCYRKPFRADESVSGKRVVLRFDGVMQSCEVFLNERAVAQHKNANTPFSIDISGLLKTGDNLLCVRCDSRAHESFTPGKETPDFQYFGGIHRNVSLTVTDSVYIGDELLDRTAAGGGLFVTAPFVSKESADIRVKACVHNDSTDSMDIRFVAEISLNGTLVAKAATSAEIAARASHDFSELMKISAPHLWHPYSPELYEIKASVYCGERLLDKRVVHYGIRSVEWTHDGLFINGERFMAHGANLHQEIFVLGNAIPDNAVFDEIKQLKANGFDLIRMAHCPHSQAYYDACDRYGVLVINCMSGWQYFNDSDSFVQSTYDELRTMIRTARNHPCIAAWETSLNESNYSAHWAEEINRIAHEEYPTEGCSRMWTCGWITDRFDITLGASQAGVRQDAEGSEKGVIISEYGDWDYGGTFSTSRRPRELGDKAMLTACANHIESLILNRSKHWFCADALWSYQDYSGFDKIMTYCGVTDMYRLDKHSAYFYKSQRDADIDMSSYGIDSGAMLRIASTLSDESPEDVTVFSNCDCVELFADAISLGTQQPDREFYGPNSKCTLSTAPLSHPPFTFKAANNGAQTLKAIGYINGKKAAEHIVIRPEKPSGIRLRAQSNAPLSANGSDARLVWAYVTDKNDTVTADADRLLQLSVTNGYVIGYEKLYTRAGAIGFWVRADAAREDNTLVVKACADGITSASLEIAVLGSSEPMLAIGAANEYAGSAEPPFRKMEYADFDSLTGGSDAAREMPAFASSCADGIDAAFGNDGNPARSWRPADTDAAPYWYVDMQTTQSISTLEISWNESEPHRFFVEVAQDTDSWSIVTEYRSDASEFGTRLPLEASGRYLRIRFTDKTSGFSMLYAYKK